MLKSTLVAGVCLAALCAFTGERAFTQDGQAAAANQHVDFAQDIQPLLRQNCVGCHGPNKQQGGMRLDRKSSAMKAGSRRITPGSSANSMVYHRVIGEFGEAMPPTGDLKPSEITLLKTWIDQGAEWPDKLSNEQELAPLNLEAVAAVTMLHNGDIAGFMRTIRKEPGLLNARGPEGSTPFMYAVLYASAPTLERLIKLGADVNAANDAHATAVMWAAHDLAKTRVLVDHGANVNVVSGDFRSPLMIASRRPGNVATVKLLLAHGANMSPNAHPETASSPLLEAATAGDADNLAALLDHGAPLKTDAEQVLTMAAETHCDRCVDLLAQKITYKMIYTAALEDAGFAAEARSVKIFLDHGADVKAVDVLGRTALMYAVMSDVQPLDVVKMLVEHGADVNAHDKHPNGGDEDLTVLDMARMHGKTAVVEYLEAHGASETTLKPALLHMREHNEIRGAVEDSIPHLQRADANFAKNSGCISCHNNSLTQMTMGIARRKGFAIDEKVDGIQTHINAEVLLKSADLLHQGFLVSVEDNFSEGVLAYVLFGLHEEGYKADLGTDAAAMHILFRQQPNGQWYSAPADGRQPLCELWVGQTAESMRALQLYMPKTDQAAYRVAISKASAWMATAKSYNNDDRAWRVAGLAWAGDQKAALTEAISELKAGQKADGSWSDLPTMDGTAYATGRSLVALHIAGMPASDAVYQRGVKWLLANQQVDGTWFVRTRALAFQPSFDAGFPGGHSQFISAAGTNWADQALLYALPEAKDVKASR